MSFSSILGAWSADPGTVAVLVVVLWLDGWRRIGPRDLLLVRSGLGGWIAREPWARVGPFALVAWWPPVVLPMLIPATRSADHGEKRPAWSADSLVAAARGRRRLRRVRIITAALRILGVMLVLWIAVAIPMATARYGIHGLVRAIVQAFVMSAVIALGTALGLRWLGIGRGSAIRAAAPLLFPFTAPRACELVIAAALRDVAAEAQAAALLGETRFLRWIRPAAYDALHGAPRCEDDASAVGELVRTLPRTMIERAVQAPPGNEEGRYCPRCARSYRGDTPECYDCGGLALVTTTAE